MSTNDEIKGQNDLEADVIKKDLCTLCGACMGMCPYNVAYQGRPVILENCKLDQGKCYAFCPRTGLDVDIINTILFKAPYPSTPLGTTQQILMARSKDKKVLAKAQYGGVVTTTLLLALKQRQIDSVVLTKSNGNILPSSYLANSP